MTQTLSHTIKSKTNKQDETANLNEIKTSLNSEGNSIELKMIQMLKQKQKKETKKKNSQRTNNNNPSLFFFLCRFSSVHYKNTPTYRLWLLWIFNKVITIIRSTHTRHPMIIHCKVYDEIMIQMKTKISKWHTNTISIRVCMCLCKCALVIVCMCVCVCEMICSKLWNHLMRIGVRVRA